MTERALARELAKTLESMNGVARARVHLTLPDDSLLSRDREAPGEALVLMVVKGEGAPSPEWVAGIVGVILSLALEVVPGLAAKWQGLDSTWQRLAWLGGCVVVPLAVLGLGCAGVDVGMGGGECGVAGVVAALRVGFAAYFAGQMTYLAVGRGRRK